MRHLIYLVFLSCTIQSLWAIPLTGTIVKNNHQETLSFDLNLGDNQVYYTIKGSTSTDQGYYQTDLDYSFIKAEKKVLKDGWVHTLHLWNEGILEIFPRERRTRDLYLMAVHLEGHYAQGMVDDGLWLENLYLDGQKSVGALDYNSLNGHYNATGGCSFGDSELTSSNAGACVLNFDHQPFLNQNTINVSLQFGNLTISGRINFSDVTKTNVWTDDKGNVHSSISVVSTTGTLNLNVTSTDGSEPHLSSELRNIDGQDEADVRRFLAFLQIMTFDIFAQ